MADQTTKTQPTAAASANGKPATAAPASGAPAGTDWESDANPYKKRFAGEQRAKTQLQQRVTQLEQQAGTSAETLATLKRLEARIGSIEDLTAGLHDRPQTASEEGDDEGARQPGPSKVDEVRQRRAQESHVQTVNRVHRLIQNGWVEGMNPQDQRLLRVKALYDGALSDPTRTADLLEALEIFNTVANEARTAPAPAPAAPAPRGKADAGKPSTNGAAAPADDESETEDDEGEGDEEEIETPRTRIAKSGAAAGQGADGRAASPADRKNLRPYDLFARAHRGEGYTPPAR